MSLCALCGMERSHLTHEDTIPKWLIRALGIQGPVTTQIREEGASPRLVGTRRIMDLVLKNGLCQYCNNVRLSQLEQKVSPVLAPMIAKCKETVLDAQVQGLLATWAVKTTLLAELALRQRHPNTRPVEGYVASTPEMAWLCEKMEPPPRSLVWLGCWDCRCETAFQLGPSRAPLTTRDGKPVAGHFTTLTVGFVAFQVFTVDFVAAEEHDADSWNLFPPRRLAQALTRIWPLDDTRPRDVAWPGPAFAKEDQDLLGSWDGALRRGYEF